MCPTGQWTKDSRHEDSQSERRQRLVGDAVGEEEEEDPPTAMDATAAETSTPDPEALMSESRGRDYDQTMSTELIAPRPHNLAAKRVGQYRQGELVSRYVVVSVIGHGGMGTVYLAYDPELDRRIAIKVMRTNRATDRARRSLVREARALAQLSHPNVVQVYDAGIYKGDVFVAMEYVEGTSVKQWCQDQAPSWREILDAYLDAGKGLAAAHDKGLVHRDIKPSNLLRGFDGRVRVVDFGLAREHSDSQGPHDERDPDQSNSGGDSGELMSTLSDSSSSWRNAGRLEGLLDEDQTLTGTVMGTPAYMAPEQHLDGNVGAAADQYGFCVALYRSLYGCFPFEVMPNESWGELSTKKLTGAFIPPPAGSEVPSWLHRALLRGLAPLPQDRAPSLRALLAVLADDPVLRRRARIRRFVWAGTMATLTCLAAWGLSARWREAGACDDLRPQLAGVWGPQVAGRVRQAFLATDAGYASDVATRTIRMLDIYANEWAVMRSQVCEARQAGARGHERDVVMLRDACLERRRSQFGALVNVFVEEADADVVRNAVQAAVELPPIAYCADVEALTARVRPPEDPVLRARVDALSPLVDRLEAQHNAGKYENGQSNSEVLMVALKELDYPPIRARAAYWAARMRDGMGDYPGAEELLRQSIRLAAKGGDEVQMAHGWATLLYVVGYRQQRLDEAKYLVEWLDTAVDLARDESVRAHALSIKAIVVKHMGRYEQAKALYEQALAIHERESGPNHPNVATVLNNLALVLQHLGDYRAAQDMFERSLAIKELTLGAEHPKIATAYNNLALVLHRSGKYEQAKRLHEHSLAIRVRTLGPDHPSVANALINLAELLIDLGEYEQARQVAARCLAIREQTLASEHPYVVSALSILARAEIHLGELDTAQRLLERAQTTAAQTLRADHPNHALVGLGFGELLSARGRPSEAVAHLDGALALESQRYRKAEIQTALAQALWAGSEDHERARELMESVRDYYESIGHAPRLAQSERLLAEHTRVALPR
ncbi:tetratricopeptide repeat protein [Haliangium sp.]|uniref:serine/threonine-protein kinase n=1 Tax=Haliangium sp. TaxID=2663208 RepID=UPI003D1156F5